MTKISKNILHVEDDPDLQQYIEVLLSDIVNITPVNTLKQARALIAQNTYDAIIVDLTLPDGSGSELIFELAEQHPSIPVVVFSVHEVTDTMINVKRVFVKGRFVDEALVDTVRSLCS